MVGDAHGAGRVALVVGHEGGEGDVGEHARGDVAGVVENDADQDVVGRRGNLLHVAILGEIGPDTAYL